MRHDRAVGIVVLFLSFVGCGGPFVVDEHAFEGPLSVWTADHEGQPLSVPRVEVMLAGSPAHVLLDTGASQHFVLAAAAWAYSIGSEPFEALATDAHGARFSVRLAERGSLLVPGTPPFAPPFVFLRAYSPSSPPSSLSLEIGGGTMIMRAL